MDPLEPPAAPLRSIFARDGAEATYGALINAGSDDMLLYEDQVRRCAWSLGGRGIGFYPDAPVAPPIGQPSDVLARRDRRPRGVAPKTGPLSASRSAQRDTRDRFQPGGP